MKKIVIVVIGSVVWFGGCYLMGTLIGKWKANRDMQSPSEEELIEAAEACMPVNIEGLLAHLRELPPVARREFVAMMLEGDGSWDTAARHASQIGACRVIGPFCEYDNGEEVK